LIKLTYLRIDVQITGLI